MIAAYFSWIPLFAGTQAQIQRYLSVPTLRQARLCLFFNMIGLILVICLCSLTGLMIFAKYYNCDPVSFDSGVSYIHSPYVLHVLKLYYYNNVNFR